MSAKLLSSVPAARSLAWGFAILLLGAAAHATLPEQDRIPANALVAVGIADTGDFWSRIDSLAVTRAINQYLDTPQMGANLNYQSFQLERGKLEQTLGYPATPDEFMKNVFHSVLIYGLPAAQPQGKPVVSLVLGVKDQGKASRLVEALDKRNREAAETSLSVAAPTPPGSVAPTAPGSAAPAPQPAEKSFAFEKLTLAKTAVSHYRIKGASGGFENGYYALAGGKFYFSSDAGAIAQLVQGTSRPAEAIGQNPDFSKLAAALPWKQANAQGWMDSAALLEVNKNPMLTMMSKMGQSEKIVFTLDVQPDGIVGKVASTPAPPATAGIKPRSLKGMTFIPAAPLAAIVYGLMDPAQSFQELNGLFGLLSLANRMSAASGSQPALQIKNPVTEMEQATGISVQNELVPALGNEVMVSINSLQLAFGQTSGQALDVVLGVEVRDPAKMKAVMVKFERYLEGSLNASMPAMPGGDPNAPAAPAKFHDAGVQAPGIRTYETGNPMLSPSYALLGDYLLFSINSASITAAISRAAGKNQQPSAVSSPAFAEMKAIAGTDQIYSYSVTDVGQVTRTVLMPLLSLVMLAGNNKLSPDGQQQAMSVVTQILPQIGTAASVETLQNGLGMGYFKVKM